uniref:Uncharacterized protein n=1 Tax=Anguilla anguilla TaxID=7936 RepID=A0A0E9PI13_ANGAN
MTTGNNGMLIYCICLFFWLLLFPGGLLKVNKVCLALSCK